MKHFKQSTIINTTLAMTLVAGAASADTITLKPSVRLAQNATAIKLSDVAQLDGPEAGALGDLVIMEITGNAVIEVPIRDVRAKLDAAGAHWGHINLSGRLVTVRPYRNSDALPPQAMTSISLTNDGAPKAKAESARDEQLAADVLDSPTLRGTIANLVVSNLHIDAKNLRLGFDRSKSALLDTPVQTTRFEVEPLSSFASDRIDLTVRTWAQGQVQQSHSISIIPMIKVQAAALKNDIQRDQVITEADLEKSEQWLPPSQANLVSNHVAAVGRVAGKTLKAGEVLRDKNIRRENLIKRGDLVKVRCLVGGVAISLQAEARADGAEGDTIEFRKQGERDTFLATITGRGEAVVDLSRKQQSQQAPVLSRSS